MAGEDFLLWQSASRHILVLATGSNIRLMATRRTWALDGTFKVVPQWYQKLFTIHAFLAGKLVPAVYCYVRIKIFPHTEQTKRKIRILLATAFLPVPHVNTGVSLLEAGTTGTLAALFQYFRHEWMTDERLPLWNVHNVSITTNNHLEGKHNGLNRKAGKGHNGFYGLRQFLIAEQGVMDTLIQQVLSGNATVGDLRRVNRVYAQKQRRVAQYTGNAPTVDIRWSRS
ncbi:hypothetical protein T09_5369 [Trichinella sp. T9]|nr:hypothetical protein T09_5369 [Trichinella sp. T9]